MEVFIICHVAVENKYTSMLSNVVTGTKADERAFLLQSFLEEVLVLLW